MGGLLLDRLTPRAVITLGLTATGAALLVLAAARTPPQMVAAAGLVGLAFELYEPATQELLARTATGAGRQAAYALLGTCLVATGAVGGVLAAVLLPLGVRWLMVVDAVTCLAAAAVTLAFVRAGPRPPATARRRGRWRPPGPLVRATLAGTLFAYGYLAVVMFVPLVLLQRGAPRWLPGLALAGAALLAPPTARLGGERLRARSHAMVLGAGSVTLGGLALVMAARRAVPVTVAAYLAWAAVAGALLGRWQAVIAEAAPEADRPRWFAFFGSSWGIAQPAVPVLAGAAAAAMGGTGPAALLTAGTAFVAVPFVMVTWRSRRPTVRSAGPGIGRVTGRASRRRRSIPAPDRAVARNAAPPEGPHPL